MSPTTFLYSYNEQKILKEEHRVGVLVEHLNSRGTPRKTNFTQPQIKRKPACKNK